MITERIAREPNLILGFGVEGQSTYQFLRRRFFDNPITIADRQPLERLNIPADLLAALRSDRKTEFHCGALDRALLDSHGVAIKSPGMAWRHSSVVAAESAGLLVTTHMEIFFELHGSRGIIGITGTKGKSTTTSLIYKILKDAGRNVRIAGNIGYPPLTQLDQDSEDALFVIELSSYQLDRLRFSPHVAVLLNIVPEHLGQHDSTAETAHHLNFAEYIAAKENITIHQVEGDALIFNADYPIPSAIAGRSKARRVPISVKGVKKGGESQGYHWGDGRVEFLNGQESITLLEKGDIPLLGVSNAYNTLAAVAAARIAGASPEQIRQSVRGFQSLPHRLEDVGVFEGIHFYDDSCSTVPESTIAALEALGPRVQTLILGGHDRGIDFTPLFDALRQTRIQTLILFPPSGRRMLEGLGGHFRAHLVNSMEEAVRLAFETTSPDHVCLLSPSSPAYGLFRDFRDRGDAFKKCVREFRGNGS